MAQERFCLTEQHVRCEFYKLAQAMRAQALAKDRVSPDTVRNARFRPVVRSVPTALEPAASADPAAARGSLGARRGPLVALLGAGALVVALGLFLISGGLGGGAAASPSATIHPSVPSATTRPTPTLTPTVGVTPSVSAGASSGPSAQATPTVIEYEVQQGERLKKIAERCGVKEAAIVAANEFAGQPKPWVEEGDRILVPLPAGVTSCERSADEEG
jgi:LysM repeat protein